MLKKLLRYAAYLVGILAALAVAGYFAFQKLTSPPAPVNPVVAGSGPTVTLMDFANPPTTDPIAPGWWQLGFFTKPHMKITFVEKDSMKTLRCETNGSGSIFGRHTDINLGQFPNLSWRWLVEQPVVADAPETEWKGDDHPARLLLHFLDSKKTEHYFEIIWSNGVFKAGQWKIIGNFYHYVANGGDAKTGENTNKWFSEKVNLLDLYRTATNITDTPRLINIAIFCDTDDTRTKSIAYFGKVELEK
jgi:Protein of unknown function (DUF3047)